MPNGPLLFLSHSRGRQRESAGIEVQQLVAVAEIEPAGAGVDVLSCDLPEVTGAMGKFILTQMAAVAELEPGDAGDGQAARCPSWRSRS
jgi:hypothetical protein